MIEGMPKSSKESIRCNFLLETPTPALLPLALTLFGTAVVWKHRICHADLVFHAKVSMLIR
jgi:hypothetical protein